MITQKPDVLAKNGKRHRFQRWKYIINEALSSQVFSENFQLLRSVIHFFRDATKHFHLCNYILERAKSHHVLLRDASNCGDKAMYTH